MQTNEYKNFTNHEKGKNFEKEFGDWLLKEKKYKRCTYKEWLAGAVAQRGYDVDIHGVRQHEFEDSKTTIIIWSVIGALVVGALLEYTELWYFAVIGAVIFFLLKKYYEKQDVDVWIECKNQTGNVKRQQMQKFISSVEDVKSNDNAAWKPDKLIFVSATGFDTDALAFAKEHEVDCYIKNSNGFNKVN